MTLNIGGGFSLLRCASNMVSSLCCAIPPDYAPSNPPKSDNFRARPFPLHLLLIPRSILIFVGGRCNAAKGRRSRNAVLFHGLGEHATLLPGVLDDARRGA